jgi:hypothetical protein
MAWAVLMATSLYPYVFPTASVADVHRGTNSANLRGTTIGWIVYTLSPTRGSGDVLSSATPTVAGPTAGIEYQPGTQPYEFISPPLDTDITISGTITCNICAHESSMSANVAINCVIDRMDSSGGLPSEIGRSTNTAELGTSTAPFNFTITPTSTNMLKGDRIRLRIYGDDSTTNMASGFTWSMNMGGTSGGAGGDTYITFTETFGFASTTPAGTQLFLTDTTGPAVGSDLEREMWTSRGGAATTATRSTTTGWTAPLQVQGAGSVPIEWYTKPLSAFTLSDLIRVNVRVHETNAAANCGVRAEIAVTNEDGSGAVVWGGASMIDSATIGVGGGAGSSQQGEVLTSETAVRGWIAGDDLAVTDRQRLRLRIFADDYCLAAMVTGYTFTLTYAGTSGGATGDSWIQLTQSVTEAVTPLPWPGLMVPANQAMRRASNW